MVHQWTPLAAIGLAAALLSGCSAPTGSDTAELSLDESDLSEYDSTVALLDAVTGQITLPLDAYAMSWEEVALTASANDELMDDCLQRYGYSNPLLTIDRFDAVRYADRRYGVWTDGEARYGYELPPSPLGDRITELLKEQSQDWSNAEAECYAEAGTLPELTFEAASAGESVVAIGARGAVEAYAYAAQTAEWAQARQDWWECLTREGLTPRTGATEWGPEIPTDAEAALRAATVDVACKREVNLVQRLANIEARYQAAFVAKNQAALVAEREKVEQQLEAAREIVGTR